ncbi:DEAD/DEAH box helicase family protein [Saccharibacter sp. 17.LH.SD]|uniref:type ISP restriction/modification enzyme n=1 Tax=Saccharibacter sp. 17.LH.SD TaxID=2689393 RepID=UPI00136AF267|nr:type ISP restriction/modification enzyme [Saccharibacter sp. 17.LH.SD]MXV44704.1 DEAD/DEAH box helicase family protein [Saccharibacter sp. 17.LH.SD]
MPENNVVSAVSDSQGSPFENVLNWIDVSSPTNRDRGTNFEKLCLIYLKNSPRWVVLFKAVKTYRDWAIDHGERISDGRDTGIDLVGVCHDGRNVAIQCKFFTSGARISKKEIDSFISASPLRENGFSERLLITTAPLGGNAQKTAYENKLIIIDHQALEESGFDWAHYLPEEALLTDGAREPLSLRDYQQSAVLACYGAFREQKKARAQLHMACGTGKTLTSLAIAEKIAGDGKTVLFLAPSLGLVQQTLDSWTNKTSLPITPYVVCSDSDTGKRVVDEEGARFVIQTLSYPATTDPASLVRSFQSGQRVQKSGMTVIFATYQSIAVVHEAQKCAHGLPAFDLVICDEAHRTTGLVEEGDDPGVFQAVHDADYLHAKHRLYMTATPRIYAEGTKNKASQQSMVLASMDDERTYGPVVFAYSFRQAVDDGHLCDYRLVVLRIQQSDVRKILASSEDETDRQASEAKVDERAKKKGRKQGGKLKDEEEQARVHLDDASRIIGCWRAMLGHDLAVESEAEETDKPIPQQMKRAVAFCGAIEEQTPLVSSKKIARVFSHVANLYDQENGLTDKQAEARHVDGSMSGSEREEALRWLKAETPEGTSRILSNVRCLSEGIDVPSLDAVLFLSPRNSTADIIQSVGRVMRKAPGKSLGYIVVPIIIPDFVRDSEIETYLDAGGSGFASLWKIAAALRSHDPQLEADANQVAIGARGRITNLLTVTALPQRKKTDEERAADGGTDMLGSDATQAEREAQAKGNRERREREQQRVAQDGDGTQNLDLELEQHIRQEVDAFGGAVRARLVKRLGSGVYWDEWAKKAGFIAQQLIAEITRMRKSTANSEYDNVRRAFSTLLKNIRKTLNNAVSEEQLTGMLAQHIVTMPLFEALFGDGEANRTEKNPVARELEPCVQAFRDAGLAQFEGVELKEFWDEVQRSVRGMNAVGRQKLIKTLYEKFIKNAFPRDAKAFGVVYTPIEVVDFILHSIEAVMQKNFGHGMGADNVHVLDPFTGTGTFVTRLLASGILSPEQVKEKYESGMIWANEIMLLTYYIATINIETEYARITGEWTPFNGGVFTDTFMLDNKDLERLAGMRGNADRIRREADDRNIRVIFANPPYSSGATKAGDGTELVKYPRLDKAIAESYVQFSQSTNKNSLYDSYIRALRWSSDRIDQQGVIGFVSGAGFLEGAAAAGVRKCLAEEFSDLYVFHLRGNQRTSGELSRKEGGKIFGEGSRSPIAISILVKNPNSVIRGKIFFHDIGDYLTREQKLAKLGMFQSVEGIEKEGLWQEVVPNQHHEWINQRDESFSEFISMGSKKGQKEETLFGLYSRGLGTGRDPWVWNFSQKVIEKNVHAMVECYEQERQRLHGFGLGQNRERLEEELKKSPVFQSQVMSWTRAIRRDAVYNKPLSYDDGVIRVGSYRPFTKEHLFFGRRLNEDMSQQPRLFPYAQAENLAVCVTGTGVARFACFIVNELPDLSILGAATGTQCFSLYVYEKEETEQGGQGNLLTQGNSAGSLHNGYRRKYALTDSGLAYFQEAYPGKEISKEDVFFYVYGLLHSPEYRQKYATSLSKELPRIPRVKTWEAFTQFSQAGRKLATLHTEYDAQEPYYDPEKNENVQIKNAGSAEETFRVEQMAYASKKDGKAREKDRTMLIYNPYVTVTNIPLEAYDYIINGKPALDWVIERQCISTDQKSGITNDANRWAIEEMHNPRYPLELFLKVVTVSLETMKIVKALPRMEAR